MLKRQTLFPKANFAPIHLNVRLLNEKISDARKWLKMIASRIVIQAKDSIQSWIQ
jgi:hypothetical protein